MSFKYPNTKQTDSSSIYFGTTVADPYRWLEDDNSEETKAWVKAQNKLTFDYLSKIPIRDSIKKRMQELWDYPKSTAPLKKGNKYFSLKNNGLQNQYVLYYQFKLDDEPTLLLDPNTFSKDGTISLTNYSISPDGKYIAYATAQSGSDWNTIQIMNIETRELLPERIEWVKFSGIHWNSNGIYYSRYDAPDENNKFSGKNTNHRVCFHKINTPISEDHVVFIDKEFPLRLRNAAEIENENYLLISEMESTQGNALFVKTTTNTNFTKLFEGFNYEYDPIDIIKDELFLITNENAPNYKLISINLSSKKITEIIPESKNVLHSAHILNNKIITHFMEDAKSALYLYDLNGKNAQNIPLPFPCSITKVNCDKENNEFFYSITSFNVPAQIFSYDLNTNTTNIIDEGEFKFNPNNYLVKQEFYTSKDGTKIPIFIMHHKDVTPNKSTPALLYGYGGFNISLTPFFKTARLLWMEQGGVYAVANIRGGGEYGETWHKAGTKLNKQNVFDDFIAAAEYLISENLTSSNKLAIQGGSNGGLLIGAVVNQRPELFKVALPAVGVMDMLRFHKFTIGYAWTEDYGCSEESKEEFEYLYKYSPVHNVNTKVTYPAILVTTGDHDDRVVPAHSFKYAAAIQCKKSNPNPLLIRIETKGGHGAGKPTSLQIAEETDILSFALNNMK